MSLLIRKCGFTNYRWYTKLVKTRELCFPMLFHQKVARNLSSMHVSPKQLDNRIRKCLDYLVNEYKNETLRDNSLLQLIDLNTTSGLLNKRIQLLENIENLHDLVKQDAGMKKLAEEEDALYRKQLSELDKSLLGMILNKMCNKCCDNIILEITGGVGGQEAMLFVKNLYEMYLGYAKYLGLSYDVINIDSTDCNGLRNVSIIMSGEQVSKLRYEGGVHRVQRIPATEKSGRMHTSTASVAILPTPSEVQVVINDKDLKMETKRASGAGGQHVNKTNSAVRITHMPSGLVVECQVDRSQIRNKKLAIMKLRSMLYEQQLNQQTSFVSELRKKQMGMGLRNEKVRTYNYSQDRVTDHRLENGTFYNLKEFMQGGVALEQLEDRLHKDVQMKTLLEIVRKLETRLT
ncbi:PREDICTED: peptide chain release factor 1-like, mitochondrial [Dinoponera quadriceps]|uniref:Peptide chain release factor 1-like, mitochondrial n=1 Tax=Dinoponera quadriceps TaxID=609295 RepID=A0A6P3XQ87_DINQU|nr:PREDICTED: peptide chain release factor 1-like, mitochondrial [Dinoponera quadriceps]